jgi:hypothetical protein
MTVPSVNEVRLLAQKHTENLYNEAVTVFGHHGASAMTDGDMATLRTAQDLLTSGLMVRYQRRADEERKAKEEADAAERSRLDQTKPGAGQ